LWVEELVAADVRADQNLKIHHLPSFRSTAGIGDSLPPYFFTHFS
jgi:hypothetical protein